MHKQVLYFSIWPESRLEFADKAKEYEKKCDFQIIENGSFSCASDLLLYLDEHYKQLKQLYVIIDYLPFFSKEFNYKKEAEFISRSIMGYPEVYFMFDESYVKNNEPDLDFTLFLYKNKTQIDKLAKQYHIFNFSDKYPFCALTNQRSNLFDGTNLRYCLKCDLYDSMKAGCHNYKRIQSSRCDNLVICVEEESSQNKFNSYSLYANGFRVWPIMSAFELKDFNQAYNQTYKRDDLRIIVRDYDLQFSDADVDDDDLIIASMKSNENLVDYIRGAKYVEKEETWYSYEGKTENHFWNNLGNIPRFYISKGVEGIDIVTNYEKYTDFCRKRDIFEKTDISLFKDEVKHQILRGMYKPVTGIAMSLITDKVFYNALLSSSELTSLVGDRIYNTSIAVPDEDLLNEPVPYIIITFDGMQNEGYTKDNSFEGDTDKVQIGIEITADNREALGTLTQAVRDAVIAYFEDQEGHASQDYDLVPQDYTLSSGPVQYDPIKPCYYQTLTYNCDTNP